MSGIYIPNFEPSKEGYISYIYPDGTVVKLKNEEPHYEIYKSIHVPDHGDLIDRDKLEKDIDSYIGGEESRSRFHHWVQVQDAVIPMDKGEET